MAVLKGVDYLRAKLAQKTTRVNLRYKYYEMKNAVKDFNITIPKEWTWLTACLGWSAKAVDSIADRLSFQGFGGDDLFDLDGIYTLNSRDVLFDSAILSACISACSFIYISPDEEGFPRLRVLDGGDATGIIEPVTMMLQEGYAILDRDHETGEPVLEAYFTPGWTTFYEKRKQTYSARNIAPYPLLVPIIYRPDARRPFGHSCISRACMSIQQAALRTLKRAEISAEFYSFPQKYITGLSPDADMLDKWNATVSSLLQFTRDDEGNNVQLGAFSQMSMQPFNDQLRMFAALFAGETGLTLDDLGFATDNPSSAEAIKASHENLRLTVKKAQRTLGVGFLNAGYLAACVRDDSPYRRNAFYRSTPQWAPIFEPDASQLSGIGDAILKIQQAFPDYFDEAKLKTLTGI